MPTETGIWVQEEANQYHIFDYYLAKWIGKYLDPHEQVIDFGCGIASNLKYLHDIGFQKLLGVEGTRLDNFEYGGIHVSDLTKDFDLMLKGNVICLEVAEHIFSEHTDTFINNILRPLDSGNIIILSWAIPFQDGVGHVNCQHNIWVIDRMKKEGLELQVEDSLSARSVIGNHTSWFRNTLMIFKKI
jgi:cyclopropane fatty-acyl-phospholipid synthase-like methyltransferase